MNNDKNVATEKNDTMETYAALLSMLDDRLHDAIEEFEYAKQKIRVIEDMIDEAKMVINHEIVV